MKLAELAEKLKPKDAGEFGLEIIDGAADNAEQAAARIRSTVEALRTLPFFGGEKLIWLKDANFLGDDQKARSAAVQEALEELIERRYETTGIDSSLNKMVIEAVLTMLHREGITVRKPARSAKRQAMAARARA